MTVVQMSLPKDYYQQAAVLFGILCQSEKKPCRLLGRWYPVCINVSAVKIVEFT